MKIYGVKDKQVINILFTLLIFILTFIVHSVADINSDLNLKLIAIIAILTYAWIGISCLIQARELNFYLIFIVMSFFFFFGQHLIHLLGRDFINISRSILGERIPIDFLNQTGFFVIESILLLHLGYLLSNIFNNKRSTVNQSLFTPQSGFIKVGLILFFISVGPTVYILVNNIMTTYYFGYGELFYTEYYTSGGFNNITKFISLFTVPSLYMLLISYKGTRKVNYIVLLIFIYIVLYLMSGSRLSAILMISTLILIRHLWFKSIERKEAVKYIFICITLLLLFTTISSVRNSIYLSSDPYELVSSALISIWNNNVIFSAIEEAGFTFLATATVITYCPSMEPYNFGMTYVNNILAVFPNLFWDIHPASTNTDMIFKGYFTSYGGIGSSFIAEAYYNFGQFSLLIMPIYGWLLGYLCNKTKRAVESHSIMTFYMCMYISSVVLFYLRSDTITFMRNFTYYAVIPCVLALIISSSKKSKLQNTERKS